MEPDERLELFKEMIACEGNVYTWCYDADGQLLRSNCPQEMLLATAFSLLGCKEMTFGHAQHHDGTILSGTSLGLVWASAFEKKSGRLFRVHVIGPVFAAEASLAGISKAIKHYGKLEISMAWMNEFRGALDDLPVVPHLIFVRYAMMLHYCVTGEKISPSDITHPEIAGSPIKMEPEKRDRHKIWQSEQVLLRMVRDGDLNYKRALDKAQMLSNGVPVKTDDPLRQAKTSMMVFTSLCTRAAIEGGLSPEQSYSLGDAYIQMIEDASNYTEFVTVFNSMYSDFIKRVRKCRTNPNVSRQIQNCVDYIELHIEEKLRLPQIAQYVGYSEYYLSRKFKAEMGTSVNDYIQFVKIERAKELLATTEDSVTQIAEQLDFCSRSYFGGVFGKVVGLSPVEYRNKAKKM